MVIGQMGKSPRAQAPYSAAILGACPILWGLATIIFCAFVYFILFALYFTLVDL